MKYAFEYTTENKQIACSTFIWDYFADSIPCSLSECIDYVAVVEKVLELDVIEVGNKFIILSDFRIDGLSLN